MSNYTQVLEIESAVTGQVAEPVTNDHFNTKTHNGCVTMTNPATGQHRTLQIKTQKKDAKFAPGKRVLSLLTGSDNENSYRGFAFVSVDGSIVLWKKYRQNGPWATYADMLTRPEYWTATHQIQYDVEGTCRRCNRKLTVPESIQSGIGPVCAGMD